MKIDMIVDGAPTKVAIIYCKDNRLLYKNIYPIKQSTSNESELRAIIEGFLHLTEFFDNLKETDIEVFSDSNNAIQWCAGTFRCKAINLIPLLTVIKEYEKIAKSVTYTHLSDNDAGKMLKR